MSSTKPVKTRREDPLHCLLTQGAGPHSLWGEENFSAACGRPRVGEEKQEGYQKGKVGKPISGVAHAELEKSRGVGG